MYKHHHLLVFVLVCNLAKTALPLVCLRSLPRQGIFVFFLAVIENSEPERSKQKQNKTNKILTDTVAFLDRRFTPLSVGTI